MNYILEAQNLKNIMEKSPTLQKHWTVSALQWGRESLSPSLEPAEVENLRF